jgi:hypothetical protein
VRTWNSMSGFSWNILTKAITWDELIGVESRSWMQSYTGRHIEAHGLSCIIDRSPIAVTRVFMKRSTKSTNNLGNRDALFEGIIPAAKGLKSGELMCVGEDKYLVQSVNFDLASREDIFFAAKCNAILQHKRYTEELDENNNLVKEWKTINADVASFGAIVTYELRQFDPGLLSSTRYVFQVPKSLDVLELDRMVFNDTNDQNDTNYQVDSIDDVALEGVVRIQLSVDTRSDDIDTSGENGEEPPNGDEPPTNGDEEIPIVEGD